MSIIAFRLSACSAALRDGGAVRLLHDIMALVHALQRLHEKCEESSQPPAPCPPEKPPAVADRVPAVELAPMLAPSLAGTAANGATGGETPAGAVVWVDGGDEVIVHLESVRTEAEEGVLLASLDLETAETGRATLVVPFGVGTSQEGAVTLVTEGRARGPKMLVDRWGEAVQEALFAAIVDLVEQHANERNSAPGGIAVRGGAVHFAARKIA
jgi:hypothetical protein